MCNCRKRTLFVQEIRVSLAPPLILCLAFHSSFTDLGVSANRGVPGRMVRERDVEGIFVSGRHNQKRITANPDRVVHPSMGGRYLRMYL